ncbi:MAG: hypothetical protein EXS08_11210 [Planctomycetes bacterium]|nr:hypothetical protein [Planctomycetota bacterium]
MHVQSPLFSRLTVALAIGLGTSCASYTERTSEALRDFRSGQFGPALEAYADVEEVGSSFLSGAEAGTVALTAGDWDAALRQFGLAAQAVRELEGRALTGELGEVLASWALNDTARAYEGEGFERVYLHCGLAMAYLAKGKKDDVYVEARLANKLLESEEELYETKYEAGGWGHLISAVTYELIGDKDDAYIDYQRMVEKGVGTALAGRALVRLAKELGRDEDLPALEQAYGADVPLPDGAANIVVLAAVGLGPYKMETVLPVPTPDGLLQMAVPGYAERPQPVSALRLIEGASGDAVRTDRIENVTQIAKENLEDRLLWVAAKSVARGILKRELTKKLEDEFDLAGRVAGDLFTLFSERADLRAWLTLPDTYQACRMFVPPGAHRLTLEAIGGESVELGNFELGPGETMLVFARSLDNRLYAHSIGGQPAGANAGAASATTETTTP